MLKTNCLKFIFLFFLLISILITSCKKEESNDSFPQTVDSHTTSNICINSATLNGVVNANNHSTLVYFEYGTTTNYGDSIAVTQNPIVGNTPTIVSATLRNLTSNTKYYYRIKTSNITGIVYSKDTSFTTLDHAQLTLEATNIKSTKATLNGSLNPYGVNTYVSFEYGTTSSYGKVATAENLFLGNSITNVNVNISGLTGGTTYHYRIKTESTMGVAYGKDYTFTTLPPIPNGLYIVGSSTPFNQCDAKGKMTNTINEVDLKPRDGMYEIYMALKAGSDGFNIVEISSNDEVNYGPLNITNKIVGGTNDQIDATIQIGTFTNNTSTFSVPSEGLYHIIFDKRRNTIAIVPINHWAIIGSTTIYAWGKEFELTEKGSFNSNIIEFEQTNIRMDKGEYKFRYDNGWKLELSGDSIKARTCLGGSIDALTTEGGNIIFPTTLRGFYTINLKWTLDNRIKALLTKTGNISSFDYSNFKFGLIGNCYKKSDGVNQANWDENWGATPLDPLAQTKTPITTNNSTYTWVWDHVTLTPPSSDNMKFTIRQNDNWSGKTLGFDNVSITGSAVSNFSGDGSFVCNVAGDYKFILTINADTEEYLLTVSKY